MAELWQRRRSQPRTEPVNEDNPLITEVVQTTADQCIGFEQITVSSTSIGLTAAQLVVGPDYCKAMLETDQIRFRVDGLAPTSTVGTIINPGTEMTISGAADLADIRFIRVTTNATLDVHYYKRVPVAV